MDALLENYCFGFDRLKPELHMHFEPPPYGYFTWGEYAAEVPHAWPYAFTCFYTTEITGDGHFKWYYGWAPNTPIWGLESKQWLPPSDTIPNNRTGGK